MSKRQRQKLVYVATAAAMLAMIGGYALAATGVTTLSPQQSSNVTQSPSPGAFTGIGTVTSEQLVVLTSGMTGSSTAGTETTGAIGLSGAPSALATCATPPCTAANFITAKPATETTGDFGEQIAITVTQPAGASTNSVGFDIAFSITMTVGVTTSTVTALAYIATGSTGVLTTSAVPVFVYIDLNTTSAPSISAVQVIFNQCASATSCP
jgi:hypothetical protein